MSTFNNNYSILAPVLPPPFIIFSHVFQILKVIFKKIKRICTCKVDKTFTQVQQFEGIICDVKRFQR